VELEAYLAEGRTIDDVRRLNEAHGLTVLESGSLMQWQFTGGVPLLNAFQRPPGEGAGPLREIVSRVLDKDYDGCLVVEVLSPTLWREDPLAVAQRCHAGAMKVLAAV
jgi:sugar phosphate isomerase/epimerase